MNFPNILRCKKIFLVLLLANMRKIVLMNNFSHPCKNMENKCRKLILVVVSGLLCVIFSQLSLHQDEAKFDIVSIASSFHQRQSPFFSSLTILFDWQNCQDACMFVHPILPPWVKLRYGNLNMNSINSNKLPGSTHYMVITRGDISDVSRWAQKHKVKHNSSIGLWLMADEIDEFKNHTNFSSFDYVIRHYYFQSKLDLFFLRALGNHTCGSSPALPTSREGEPRWGVHWGFLAPHKPHSLLSRSALSTIPASQRTRNCGFIGRSTPQRELMKQELRLQAPGLNCMIQFSEGFTLGSDKLKYIAEDLHNIKIGLNPSGNNMECHRLSELLSLGTIPAMLHANYLRAPFRSVPGIIGRDWTEVGTNILTLLSENKSQELDSMSRDAASFYEELLSCMLSDMDYILRGAFTEAENKRTIPRSSSNHQQYI